MKMSSAFVSLAAASITLATVLSGYTSRPMESNTEANNSVTAMSNFTPRWARLIG